MKNSVRIISLILSITFILSLTACGVNNDIGETTPSDEVTPTVTTENSTPEETPESTPESTPDIELLPTPEVKEESTYVRPEKNHHSSIFLYKIIYAHIESMANDNSFDPDVSVSLRFYGYYLNNGGNYISYVMFIDNPQFAYTEALWSETVGEQTFDYTNGQRLEVYVREPLNERLCTLTEAYESGALTDEHLAVLNERYKAGKAIVIKEEDPELEAIKVELIRKYIENKSYSEDGIYLRYCGCYNGAYVLFVDLPGSGAWQMVREVQIGEHTLVYRDSQSMVVYYDGSFCSVEKAFEDGILTNDDIATIIERHAYQLYTVTSIH